MPPQPRPATVYRQFTGLHTNINPHAVPQGGSIQQVNVQIVRPGQLDVRPGLRKVRFDN